jgi:putative phosphoesterase
MRIALVSDIHANWFALNSVLGRLRQERFDQLVFLGDAATFGPQPRQVIETLQGLKCLNILGNTDDWLLRQPPEEATDDEGGKLVDVYQWCAAQLADEHFEFIRTFQPTAEIALDASAALLCFHGTPASCRTGIFPTTSDEDIERLLAEHQARIMTGGHTHLRMLRPYREITFVNPGSVGLPFVKAHNRTYHPPWAEYAIIDWRADEFRVEFRQSAIDVGQMIQAARQSGMPHFEWWAEAWN